MATLLELTLFNEISLSGILFFWPLNILSTIKCHKTLELRHTLKMNGWTTHMMLDLKAARCSFNDVLY